MAESLAGSLTEILAGYLAGGGAATGIEFGEGVASLLAGKYRNVAFGGSAVADLLIAIGSVYEYFQQANDFWKSFYISLAASEGIYALIDAVIALVPTGE